MNLQHQLDIQPRLVNKFLISSLRPKHSILSSFFLSFAKNVELCKYYQVFGGERKRKILLLKEGSKKWKPHQELLKTMFKLPNLLLLKVFQFLGLLKKVLMTKWLKCRKIARIANAIQCYTLFSGHFFCHFIKRHLKWMWHGDAISGLGCHGWVRYRTEHLTVLKIIKAHKNW